MLLGTVSHSPGPVFAGLCDEHTTEAPPRRTSPVTRKSSSAVPGSTSARPFPPSSTLRQFTPGGAVSESEGGEKTRHEPVVPDGPIIDVTEARYNLISHLVVA